VGKGPSPLVGFNNNVKHKGRVFHVQTEDSGVSRPHIVTHLFADGGRILKSTRTDYSEHVGRTDMGPVVRTLMKEQHKAMFIALRDGQLDQTIEGLLGPAPPVDVAVSADAAVPSRPLGAPPPRPLPALAGGVPSPPPSSKDRAGSSTSTPSVGPSRAERPATLTELVLADLDGPRPVPVKTSLGPPPKPSLRGVTPALGTPTATGTASRPPPPSRYAASRPAAIFSSSPEQRSLFGGASISEQSLDEVILSYLAEDLDSTPEK
jgi:hypothetical protein